ncbi:hypothetical protein [Nitrobacter sp. TKz-YC02]|uniref:hypothetical protein n=1 Tax=Nitrobacter sp. TKz-YC02 TaxID=3398704 RepID=UPI003CEC7131
MALSLTSLPQLGAPQYGAPDNDLTPQLAGLVQNLNEGQERATLADLGRDLASGKLDYKQAAGKVASLGDLSSTMTLLKLGQAQDASKAFGDSLTSMYGGAPQQAPTANAGDPRGIRNNNPLNLEASPFTQKQPGFSGSDGRFGQFGSMEQGLEAAGNLLQSYAQRGINTVSGIINRWAPANDGNPVNAYAQFVARKAGVDPNTPIDLNDPSLRQRVVGAMAEFENGRPVQVASNDPAALPANVQPTQGFAIPGQQQPGGISPRALQLIKMMSVPGISDAQKDAGGKLLAAELDQSKLPDQVKQYVFARSQDPTIGSMTDWIRGNKAAGKPVVNVDTQGQNAFAKAGGEAVAKRFEKLSEEGDAATQDLALVGQLRDLGQQITTGGAAAVQGKLAEFGIKVGKNVGEIEAYGAIVDKLTPQQRVPGSGASSDLDVKMFKGSLPSLIKTPEGNEIIQNTLAGVAQYKVDRAKIAEAALAGDIEPKEAIKQLRALPNPYDTFKKFAKGGFKADPNASASKQRTQMAPQDVDASLSNARAAIARNPAIRNSVIKRLRENGLDPGGL